MPALAEIEELVNNVSLRGHQKYFCCNENCQEDIERKKQLGGQVSGVTQPGGGQAGAPIQEVHYRDEATGQWIKKSKYGQIRGCSFVCSEDPQLAEAKFYCLQHDMFLCRNCFDDHLGHRGADSIKNHLAKDFSKWSNMQNRIDEIGHRLDTSVQRYRDLIEILRDYYSSENINPGGLVFANSAGTYSATIKNYQCV